MISDEDHEEWVKTYTYNADGNKALALVAGLFTLSAFIMTFAVIGMIYVGTKLF